jgi:RND family efflux transporter MFP subunit
MKARLRQWLGGKGKARWLKIGLPAAILVTALLGAGILKATKPEVRPRPETEKQWPVAVIPAKIADIVPERRFYGEVIAGREADLRAEVAARVVDINENFIDGGIVQKGDLLVAFDAFDYEAQVAEREAELVEAKARLVELEADHKGMLALLERDREQTVLRERDVARRARLIKQNNVSEKTFDDAKLALSEARQRVIEREQNIEKLDATIESQKATIKRRQVAVERAKRDLDNTKLSAPFDGFLTSVGTALGRYVSVGDSVAKLIQADRLEVKFQVGNRLFIRLSDDGGFEGKKAKIVWRAGGEQTYAATVARAESVVDAASGGVNLYAKLDKVSAKTRLRPGIFVEVFITDRSYADVIEIPESALHEDTVYTVVNDRLQERRVEVVARVGENVLIRGPFKNGDPIVTTNFNEIGPGLRVTVR